MMHWENTYRCWSRARQGSPRRWLPCQCPTLPLSHENCMWQISRQISEQHRKTQNHLLERPWLCSIFTFLICHPHHWRPSFHHRHQQKIPPRNQLRWYLRPHHQVRKVKTTNIWLCRLVLCYHGHRKRTRCQPILNYQVFSRVVSHATEHETPPLIKNVQVPHIVIDGIYPFSITTK